MMEQLALEYAKTSLPELELFLVLNVQVFFSLEYQKA